MLVGKLKRLGKKIVKAITFRDTVGSVVVAEQAKVNRLKNIIEVYTKDVAKIDAEVDKLNTKYYKNRNKAIIRNTEARVALRTKQKKELEAFVAEQKAVAKRFRDRKNAEMEFYTKKFTKEELELQGERDLARNEVKQAKKILKPALEALGL